LSTLALMLAATAAWAQFPDRAITMVVPFPPGGVADTVARPMAEAMSRDLKQSVVIENKAGAGGAIGMAHAAKAKPDGYTVLMALSSYTVLPEADKVLGRTPQYQLADLKPVARVTADPTVLAVRAESPWKTYAEFIAAARAAPGKITVGSSGNYGTMHVPMAMLALSQGVQMTHVPYTGAGPAIVGLLGGQVDALSTGPASIVQHVKAGKVRVLAHWGEGRLAALPDAEPEGAGRAGRVRLWSGIFVPAGTPEPVVARLRRREAAANDERVKQVLGTAGPILYLDAPRVPALSTRTRRRWRTS
jgi:tripartite-type tricarboxylate transporter receptor subunit TctC